MNAAINVQSPDIPVAALAEDRAAAVYRHCAPVTIGGFSCQALIDSGNLWRCCMSDELARTMGITPNDLRPIAQTRVQTAKDGAELEVLGELKHPLKIQFGDLAVKFSFRPVVLKDLAMHCNISGPFLRRHNIDQIHSKNALRIQSHLVPLCQRFTTSSLNSIEVPFTPVYSADTVVVPPMSRAVLPLRLPQVQAGLIPSGDGLLEGTEEFSKVSACVPTLAALVQVDGRGRTKTIVINPFEEPATIKEGTRYGHFRKACYQQEEHEKPWRVAIVGAGKLDGRKEPPHSKKGLVLRQRLHEAISKAKEKSEKGEKDEGPSAEEARQWSKERKKKWLREEFKLDSAPMLTTQSQKEEALELLLRYFDVISIGGEFGATNLIEHEIHTGDHRPINLRYRPINPALENDLRDQLAKWKRHDVIEPSKSPWSFPLVAAPKKGQRIRWCVDYRKLNDITTKDTHPLPSIEDNLVRLSNSRVFSTLDGCGAFHVIGIRKQDRPKTSFSTPWGTYQYTKMPFGLCNGPASYSRLVQLVLHGIPGEEALPYLDDTIVHSSTVAKHMVNLEKVLLAHREAGLKLQPSKCHLFQEKVEYLGHLVSAEGVGPVPDYVKAVKDWPLPKTKSEARTFLGKCGYYRRFIRNYSAIAGPWTDVTGKGTAEEERTPLTVTPEMEAAFDFLKDSLLKAPVLAYPQFHNPSKFILDTDWSHDTNSIGAVLSQVQEGKERVIMYGAKKLATSQKNYCSTKGELVAVLHFLRAWKYYLRFRPFILRTDHQPLKYIRTMEPLDGHVERWLATLADYDFEVVHRSGKAHSNADGLSRAPHIQTSPEATTPIGTDEEGINAVVVTDVDGKAILFSPQQLKEAQENDETLSQVRRWKDQGPPNSLQQKALSQDAVLYLQLLPQLSLNRDGVLQFLKPQTTNIARSPVVACLPRDLWDQVIRIAHETGGHMGINTTLDRVRQHFYFPHMKQEVAAVLQGCHQCQQKRGPEPDQKGLLLSQVNGWPFQRLSIDFVGPLSRSKKGHCYILTVRDTFSGWLEAYPIRSATAEAAARLLEKEVFFRFGIPESIHTDQGTQFTSAEFNKLASILQIRNTTTPAYNPKSNPVERAHRDLGGMLRSLQNSYDGSPGCWHDLLPQAVFALNTAVSSSTGLSPYQIVFNRLPATPLSTLFGNPPTGPAPPTAAISDATRQLQRRAELSHEYVRRHLHAAVARRRRQYNKERKDFQIGSRVWLFSPVNKLHVSRKLNLHWTGPWTILEKINPVLFRIQPHPSWNFPRSSLVVSVDRLVLYNPPRQLGKPLLNLPPPLGADLALPGDDFAEYIQDDADLLDDDDEEAFQSSFLPNLHPAPANVQLPPDSDDDNDDGLPPADDPDDSDNDDFVDAEGSPPPSPLAPSQRGETTPPGPAQAPDFSSPVSSPADGSQSQRGDISSSRRQLRFTLPSPPSPAASTPSSATGARPKQSKLPQPQASTSGTGAQTRSPRPPLPPKPRLELELFPDPQPSTKQSKSKAVGKKATSPVRRSLRVKKPTERYADYVDKLRKKK